MQFFQGMGLIAAATVGLVGAGCGGDDDGESGPGSGGSTGGDTSGGGAPGSAGDGGAPGTAGDGGTPGTAGGAGIGGVQDCGAESISDNHGHELVVPARDVAQGVERTYDITGTSSHPHTVILTASDFETPRQGGIVMVTSSSDASHSHEVTVSCAG